MADTKSTKGRTATPRTADAAPTPDSTIDELALDGATPTGADAEDLVPVRAGDAAPASRPTAADLEHLEANLTDDELNQLLAMREKRGGLSRKILKHTGKWRVLIPIKYLPEGALEPVRADVGTIVDLSLVDAETFKKHGAVEPELV